MEEIKLILRALVISHKDGCSPSTLAQDFKETEGYEIPVEAFGFSNLLDFFVSLTDVLKLGYSPKGEEVLFAVGGDDVKHIEKLVAEQRDGKTRQFVPSSDCLPKYVSIRKKLPKMTKWELPKGDIQNVSFTRRHQQVEYEVRFKHQGANSRRCYGSQRIHEPFVPFDVRRNLIELLSTHPPGFRMCNLITLYEGHFNSEFEVTNFGFDTVLDCLKSIPDVCEVIPEEFSPRIRLRSDKLPKNLTESHDVTIVRERLVDEPSPEIKSSLVNSERRTSPSIEPLEETVKTKSKAGQWTVPLPLLPTSVLRQFAFLKMQKEVFDILKDVTVKTMSCSSSSSDGEKESDSVSDSGVQSEHSDASLGGEKEQTGSAIKQKPLLGRKSLLEKAAKLNAQMAATESTPRIEVDFNVIFSEAEKNVFKRLITNYKEGVTASDFYNCYVKYTGREMDATKWGLKSPIEVFHALPSIFRIEPPQTKADDYRLHYADSDSKR